MNTSEVIENPCAIDLYYAKAQSGFLSLHLQLAGEFETTYQNENGKEIKVTRSADGKFASKGGGGSSSSSDSESKDKSEPAAKTTNTAKLAKEVLSGEKGDQVKDALVAATRDPDVKTGIRKASFADILGGAGDAMSNASDYIGKKLKEAKTVASKQPLGVIVGEVLVGAAVLAAVAAAGAVAAGASAPVATGVFVATNLLGLRMGDSISTEKFQRERAEKFKKFQQPVSYKQMDEQLEKLKKDKAAQEKLHKAVKKATSMEEIEESYKKEKRPV